MLDDRPESPYIKYGESRPLTQGEIDLAKTLFGSSIDYARVRVHHKSHNWFQGEETAMAPDGNLYYPTEIYRNDFSQGSSGDRSTFIHEMTHVWQKQNNLFDPVPTAIGLWWDKGRNYHAAYDISNVSAFKDLREYNMEQQGELVRSFFEMKERQKKPPEPFKPADYDAKERSGTTRVFLSMLGEIYRKDPEHKMVKSAQAGTMGFLGGPAVFDSNGDAHLVRVPVAEQRRQWQEDQRAQEIAEKTLARIMYNFARDPNYINKCPAVELPTEDSRLVTTGPKTTGMG